MKISVVIPCYNAAETVGVQLEALASQQYRHDWEVIVANNGSTDNSVDIVEQYCGRLPCLKIVDASARQGAAYAINRGAAAAAGESLLFCDADDEVGEGWVTAMANALEKYDFVGCRFEVYKLNPSWVPHKNPQANNIQMIWYPPYLPHAGSGGMGVKRHLHETIGGFDETLFILYDTDYCWRLQMKGVELHFVPDAVLHVRSRTTIKGIYKQSRGYAEHNVLLSKRYQAYGQSIQNPWRRYIRAWFGCFKLLPRAYSQKGRARLAWQLGQQVGRLRGVLKYRVPPV